jgi:translocation and assembly module TamB
MQLKIKRIFVRAIKITGWVVGSFLVLLLLIIGAIQIPAVQQKITQRAVAFLEEKIGTDVAIESLYISFPKNIVLKGLYLESQSKDTLLFAGKLSVDTDLWALTRNEIQLNKVTLENTTASVLRSEGDSAFNFSYILTAFAGDSTAVPDTLEQKGWDFSLKSLALENIKGRYHDRLTGNNLDVNLGNFEVDFSTFDLKNNAFGIKGITLENTTAGFVQTKLPEVTKAVDNQTPDSSFLNLNLDELNLKNVHANYKQEATGQVIRLNIGETVIEANHIDLKKQIIDLEEIALSNTFVSYQQHVPKRSVTGHSASSSGHTTTSSDSSSPVAEKKTPAWHIRLAKITMKGNSVQFYDFTKPYDRTALDFDHLWISNLGMEIEDVAIDGKNISADLRQFTLREKSGFALNSFQTKFILSEDSASVRDFVLQTQNSKLQLTLKAGYRSLADISHTYPEAVIEADINQSHIGIGDILFFNPALLDSLPLKLKPETSISLDVALNGTLKNLSVHHLVVKAFSDTYLKTKGRIVGLPEMKALKMNITLEKFFTTKNDILAIIPDTLLPDSIAPPAWVNVNGQFKGSLEKAEFRSLLTSTIGTMNLNGKMNLDSASVSRGFSGDLAVNEFDLGELLMQPKTIGKLNLLASVNSEGLTKKEMNSAFKGSIQSFEYKDYVYKNLEVNATVKNDVLKGWAALKDQNLDFALKGDINFQEEVPHYNFTFDLRNIDFKALHLAERPLKARGTVDVNMATADMRILNGQIGIRKVAIFNGDELYAVDSLLFASIDQEGRSEIDIDSDLMKGSFRGSINVFTLPAVIREYFNTYYSLHDSVEQSYEAPQHFKFDLKLRKTELLTEILIPPLESFVPGEIKGEFDSKAKQLDLRFNITEIRYANVGVKAFRFSTNSDSSKLNYNIFIDKVQIDSLLLDGLEFNGTVSHDSIRTNIVVLDSLDLYKYVLGGTFFSRDKEFELRLNPKQIRLNYEDWTVPPANFIRFGGPKLIAQNVELVNGREKIILESNEQPGSPLFIGFRELNLEYLASMVAQEKPVSGLLNGDINIFSSKDNFQFTADVKINNFKISDLEWGNLSLDVKQKVKNRFDVNFSLIGAKNDIRAEGYYTAGETPDMNITTTISKFDVSVLQPLASSQVRELSGNITADIRVKGTTTKPDIKGGLTLKNTAFFSTYLNSAFSVKNETISFTDRGISFDRFELVDANKNIARVDGMIRTDDYRDFNFRLDLTTQKFRLLNTTAKDNELFYGKADVTATAKIRGTFVNPSIDMELGLADGDHLTYVVPQSEASILEQQGIVKFVDKTFKADPFMKKIQTELADTVKSTFSGLDLTAKIELTDKESFTIIIDPTTDDQLTVKGNTTLTLQMDRTGDLQLSGRYEISEGTYNLSFYKFVKRQFNIEKGSTMTWSGDPLNADMDIHAIFKVETSPIDLLANQLTGSDPQEVNRYKQRLPFLVYLNIGGQLLKPDISFKLEMPLEDRNAFGGNVYAKLQDINSRESDLNKQVFALLILKRFIADNPFETQGSGFEGTARTSVSKILSEQLNRLSENVKGVELSFDVKSYEDYSTGQGQGQTELQLGLSKSLLNDRLVVKLSGNVDIEGENTNREMTDYIGDLALEYLLTDDGRFRITGFRNSNYDMIDGELIETGAGLIYIKDYNALSELFKANAKKK